MNIHACTVNHAMTFDVKHNAQAG